VANNTSSAYYILQVAYYTQTIEADLQLNNKQYSIQYTAMEASQGDHWVFKFLRTIVMCKTKQVYKLTLLDAIKWSEKIYRVN